MAKTQLGNSDITHLSVVGGKLVQKVDESVQGAVRRDYEVGKGDKKTTGTKWELQFKDLTGKIVGLDFKDSDYGKNFILTLDDGEEKNQISMGTDSRYFADVAKKLPNINLNEEIEFNPYDFKTKDGKQLRGVSIKQDGKKIEGAYWDGKKSLNGMPSVSEADRKTYDSDDWKMFFTKVKKFLVKEVEKVKLPEPTTPASEEMTAEEVKEMF